MLPANLTKIVTLFASATDIDNSASVPALGYTPRIHTGGWSETMYSGDLTASQIIQALTQPNINGFNAFLPWRAAILPKKDSIIGVRLYKGTLGKGQSYAFSYAGGFNQDEQPQVALLMKSGAIGLANSRRWTLRGIPDDQVQGGEFYPGPAFQAALAQFMNAYGNFGFIGLDLNQPRASLAGIDAGGNVVVKNPPQPFLVNTMVTISRTVDVITGLFRRYVGKVDTVTADGSGFHVVGWTGNACNGGTAQVNVPIYCPFNISTMNVVRITLRKVGRPFEVYRGRRSKRRKAA